MKYLFTLLLFLTGCTTTPNHYGAVVLVTGGEHKGQRGRLIGDCPGIENYQVKLFNNQTVCIHIWNMESWYRYE